MILENNVENKPEYGEIGPESTFYLFLKSSNFFSRRHTCTQITD